MPARTRACVYTCVGVRACVCVRGAQCQAAQRTVINFCALLVATAAAPAPVAVAAAAVSTVAEAPAADAGLVETTPPIPA